MNKGYFISWFETSYNFFAPDKDSQISALPTSIYFSHGRPPEETTSSKTFGGEDASYLSQKDCEKLIINGDDEVSLEVGLNLKVLVPREAWIDYWRFWRGLWLLKALLFLTLETLYCYMVLPRH